MSGSRVVQLFKKKKRCDIGDGVLRIPFILYKSNADSELFRQIVIGKFFIRKLWCRYFEGEGDLAFFFFSTWVN